MDLLSGETLISEILLRSSRNKEKKVVVITEKGLSGTVNIWDELRPSSLGDNGKIIVETFFNATNGTRIHNVDIGKDGGMWIRPELYFLSEKLLTSGQGNILSSTEEELNIKTKFILPFKKEILDFFSATEIKEKLNPAYTQDGNVVKFSFTLPVGTGLVKIEKTYKTKATQKYEGEISEIEAPIVEIFPDYLGENWRKYFLFQGNAESYSIRPVVKEKECTISFRDREYKNGVSQKIRVYEISGDDCFPEAAEINNESDKPLGLILISKQSRVQGLKNKWTIGVDFGTSNTNVYKNRGSADSAERWSYDFPNYYRHLTANDTVSKTKILEEYFSLHAGSTSLFLQR